MAWTQVKSKMPPGMAPAAFNFGGCTFSGKVVTFCGITADSPAPTTRTYQVDASGNWTVMTTSGTAPAARHGHAVEQCGPTKMILFGGSSTPDNAAGSLSNEVFTLNLGLKSWMKPRVTGDLPAVAHHRTAMVGGNSNLVSVGGMLSGGNATADVYVLNMTRMSWTKANATGAVPEPRYMHCVVPVPGSADTVVVFGGTDGSKFFNDTLTFNIASNTWTALPAKGEAPCARANAGHGVVGGTMYVFGGRAAGGALLDDLWGLEIASGTWTCYAKDGGAWPSARDGHVLLPVGGSNMMLVGGQDPSSVFTLNTTKVGGGSASPAPGTPSSARRTTSPAPATTSPAPVDHSAEEARKKAAAEEEARKKAAAEEEARKKAAAAAEEEARKKAAAAAEEERKKAAAAAAAAEEEARKAVAAASAADASAAEKEAAMKKAEEAAAARKKADEEAAAAARKKAEDDAAAAARKKAEDDAAAARKKTEDAAAARKKAEDDAAAARKKAEEAAAARKKLEEEAAAARKKAEEDAARRKAEAEEESRRKAAQRVSASAAPVNVDSAALQAAQERIAELEELLEAANARIADLEAQVASGGSGGGEECSGGPPPPPPPPPPMGMGRGRLPTAMDEEGGGAGGPPPPPPPPPPGGMKMPGSPRPGPMGGAGRGDLLAQIAAGRKLKHAVVAPRPELPVEKTPPAGAKAAAGGVSMDDILKIQARLKKKREENSSLDKKLEGRPSPKELEERNIIHEPALPKLRSTGNVLQERLAHRPSPEEVEASGITDFGAKLKKSETKKADAPAAPQVETDFGTKLRRSETRKSDTQAVAAQIDFRTVLKPGAKD